MSWRALRESRRHRPRSSSASRPTCCAGRPDVRSAELQAAAQSAQIGVAKGDLLPVFSLNGSLVFVSTIWGNSS
jgi:outer membrane protein TolC